MSNIATALSGLQNVSLAIDTVSNNIANANTIKLVNMCLPLSS
jgi:flagellar hook protein FlgE